MPIYAYRCSACGHAKDVLQKMSDPMLTTCPACGADTYSKQVTAAGFQLKGSGWYVTDFRGGITGGKAADAAADKPASASDGKPADKPAAEKPAADKQAAPAAAPLPPPAPST
jgi:putative FmdB family regulatory protein